MPRFYITGLYHTKEFNDSILPPIEVEAKDQLCALVSIGATVWTEEEFNKMRKRAGEQGLTWPEPIKAW